MGREKRHYKTRNLSWRKTGFRKDKFSRKNDRPKKYFKKPSVFLEDNVAHCTFPQAFFELKPFFNSQNYENIVSLYYSLLEKKDFLVFDTCSFSILPSSKIFYCAREVGEGRVISSLKTDFFINKLDNITQNNLRYSGHILKLIKQEKIKIPHLVFDELRNIALGYASVAKELTKIVNTEDCMNQKEIMKIISSFEKNADFVSESTDFYFNHVKDMIINAPKTTRKKNFLNVLDDLIVSYGNDVHIFIDFIFDKIKNKPNSCFVSLDSDILKICHDIKNNKKSLREILECDFDVIYEKHFDGKIPAYVFNFRVMDE